MAVTNPDNVVTKQDLADFYEQIKPYLGSYPVAIANKFSKGDIYSTSEKIVGQWTDGKPVYMKAYHKTGVNMPSNAHYTIDSTLTSSYVDSLINAFGSISLGATKYSLPHTNSSDITMSRPFYVLSSGFTLYCKSSTSESNATLDVVVFYTKTTDSSTPIGDENDYSTTEKIVGTWIDGKPIYQKTIQDTLPTTSTDGTGATKNISIGSTVVKCIDAKVTIHNTSVGIDAPLPFEALSSNTRCYASYYVNNNSASSNKNTVCLSNTKASWSGLACDITLQYLKS